MKKGWWGPEVGRVVGGLIKIGIWVRLMKRQVKLVLLTKLE